MTSSRDLGFGVVLGVTAILLPGCSAPEFPSAAVVIDGSPGVAVKPCRGVMGITRLRILEGRYGDGPMPTVWTASLQNGAPPQMEVPIRPSVTGYTIFSRAALDPAVFYTAESEVRLDKTAHGFLPISTQFRVRDLAPGRATTVDDPDTGLFSERLSDWLRSTANCPENDPTDRILGIAGAVTTTGILITVGAFLREARRRRRQPANAVPPPPLS